MSIFENDGNYYANYSVPAISFCNRKASSAEFRKYLAEHPSVQEDVPSSIMEELQKMPSASTEELNPKSRLQMPQKTSPVTRK